MLGYTFRHDDFSRLEVAGHKRDERNEAHQEQPNLNDTAEWITTIDLSYGGQAGPETAAAESATQRRCGSSP